MKTPEAAPELPAKALAAVDIEAISALDLSRPDAGLAMPSGSPDSDGLVRDLVSFYPPRVQRKRSRHIKVNDPHEIPKIEANVRTAPGIITQRGCCYAGCKGVVLGPITDVLQIVHGPVGCSYYAWMTRRNQADVPDDAQNFLNYAFTTDMTENEIIFGGEKKLAQAIREAYEIFHPRPSRCSPPARSA